MEILITNARLLGEEGVYEIAIDEEGKISQIGRKVERTGDKIDAQGGLVLPTFVEPHIHLDKVLLSEKLREASSISEARQMVRNEKENFTRDLVRDNAERVIPWAIESGVTSLRTHLDVDRFAETKSVEAVLELKKKYNQILDIQIVAFPQEGLIKEPETEEYINRALDLGARVLGGMPEAEKTSEDSKKHIDLILSIARERRADLDIHCDVLPGYKNIEYLASRILEDRPFEWHVTVDHLIALSYYDLEYASRITQMIREASISVVTNPCTMISGGETVNPPSARGITLVKELVQAGVNVSYGSDNIVDPYNPYGDLNPLSNGFLLAYGAKMNSLRDMEILIRMATDSAARILRLHEYGLEAGRSADLNVFYEATPRELIRKHARPAYVIKKGKIIVENMTKVVRHY